MAPKATPAKPAAAMGAKSQEVEEARPTVGDVDALARQSLKDSSEVVQPRTSVTSVHGRGSRRGSQTILANEEAENNGPVLGEPEDERKDYEAHLQMAAMLTSEFMGTFFLAFVVGVSTQSASNPLAAVAIGLTLGIQIYCYGSVSGGMLNPAVTFAVLLSGRKKINFKTSCFCIGIQFLGGMLGGLVALGTTGKSFCFDWGANLNGSRWTSFLLEIVYTGALCNTVLASGTSFDVPNHYFGLAIGLTVTASAYACNSYDQGSFNPAVTWGINVANWIQQDASCGAEQVFAFLTIPFLGGALAALIFMGTRSAEYAPDATGHDPAVPPKLREKLLAEFVGTFYLVFTVGVAVTGNSGFAAVAIGVMLGVNIYTFASVSGACLNPAVTLAVFLSGRGKMSPRDAGLYMGVEFLAGIIGAFMAYAGTARTFYFDHKLTPAGGGGSSCVLEAFCTMALCMAVLVTGTSKDAPNEYYGFAIGLTVTAMAITCGDFNQGSLNPAVTFGINLANYANSDTGNPSGGGFLLFLCMPYVGACLAAVTFMVTRFQEYRDSKGRLNIFGASRESVKELETE